MRSLAWTLWLLPLVVAAQRPPQAAPAPERPAAAFDNYRRWSVEAPAIDWARANEQVGRLAGHTGHLQARQQPAGATGATGATAVSPPAPPAVRHDHHRHTPAGSR